MKERILESGRRLFTPPVFAEDEKTQTVSQIYTILWIQILSITVIGIVLSFLASAYIQYWLVLTFSTIVICWPLLQLAKRGHTYLSGLLLIVELWAIITIFAWTAAGIGTRAAWGYFIVVFIAGMLLGRTAGIITAGICSLATLAIAFLSPVPSPNPIQFWLTNTMYLVFVILLQFLASRSIRELLAKTSRELRERLLAQAALFESEKKHREMVNSLPFCVFEADLLGNLTFVNQTALDWFGYSRGEFLAGLNILDIVADVDRPRASENVRRIGAGEEVNFHEYLVRRKDGSFFTALIRPRLIYENGVPLGLQGNLIDISDRKRAEKELQIKNLAIASSFSAVVITDLNGNFTYVNDTFLHMWGYTAAEAQNLNVTDLDADKNEIDLIVKDIKKKGSSIGESLAIRKDGSLLCIQFSASLVSDTAGEAIAMLATFIDISERKQAQGALQAREDMLSSIFRAAPTGIGVVRDRVLTLVNSRICAMTGWTQEELIGKSSRLLYSSDADFEYVGKEKYRQIAERGTGTVETRWRRKDGRIIDVLMSSTPINPLDLSAGVTFTALDITERKQAEKNLFLNSQRTQVLLQFGQMTEAPLQTITDFALEEAVKLTQSKIGYVAFLNEDESILTMHSWSKSAMAECDIADKPIVYPVASTGLWGEAVRQRRPILSNDYPASPWKKGFPQGHVALARHMNVPVFQGSRIVLVAGVGNKTEEYSLDDAQQLTLIMEGMWRLIEHKQEEEKLLESERRYRTLFESADDGIFLLHGTRLIDCNAKILELFGCTHEHIDSTSQIMFSPEKQADGSNSRELATKKYNAALAGHPQRFEWMYLRSDGTPFSAEVSLNCVELSSGMHLLVVIRDITVRKRAEKALQESEEKYRLTMDVAPIGIYVIQDMLFKFVNPEMARLHGYEPAEMIDTFSASDVMVVPEQRELVRQTLLNRQAGVHGKPYEVKAVRKDGSTFDALVWGKGIVYEGQPASIGTLIDISERKHAEAALTESEHRYRTLFDTAGDSIFVMKDNLFFECNSKTLEMFGCQREQIIGVSPDRFSPLLQPDGRESLEKALEKIKAAYSGIPQSFEWLHSKADGTPFMTDVSLSRFELAATPYLLAIVRNTADRKMLEEQLRQAQKMEAVGILAGGIAHDFNNILSTIVGYASLLQMQSCQEDKSKEYLERILASTERAASLTHSLLAFSRKQAIDLRPVDLNDSIFGFHKVLARLIGEDIEFMLNLSRGHLMVDADIRQIEQVLMNLATNARDAMPHGGKLTITTRSLAIEKPAGEMPDGPYAVISVCDTGSGMEKEIQEHLFEPFYTTKEVGKGTGLGLAIVYGIVKNHKGFIKLESAFTQGTTFHIYLPLKFQSLPKNKRRLQVRIPRGHETILLVEDDAAVRHATRAMLEEFGYTIIEAANGQEALVVFEKNRERVDLLLSDLIMPKKNGRETRDAILKLQPGMKTIFMSGYTSDIIARKGIMEPGMHLLLKPLHPAELLEKIRAVLDS